jgi:hypothetical protein
MVQISLSGTFDAGLLKNSPTNPLFTWKTANVDTFRLLISTYEYPVATRVALDEIARQKVQLFHHINIGGFLLLPVKSGNCYISHLSVTLWKLKRTTRSTSTK